LPKRIRGTSLCSWTLQKQLRFLPLIHCQIVGCLTQQHCTPYFQLIYRSFLSSSTFSKPHSYQYFPFALPSVPPYQTYYFTVLISQYPACQPLYPQCYQTDSLAMFNRPCIRGRPQSQPFHLSTLQVHSPHLHIHRLFNHRL
jgi:hypothetical protein